MLSCLLSGLSAVVQHFSPSAETEAWRRAISRVHLGKTEIISLKKAVGRSSGDVGPFITGCVSTVNYSQWISNRHQESSANFFVPSAST